MKDLEKYEEYCELSSKLNDKKEELNSINSQRAKVQYGIDTLEREIDGYDEFKYLSKSEREYLKGLRVKKSFEETLSFADGGGINEECYLTSFKKSEEYNSLDADEKKIFKESEAYILASQHKLKNALFVTSTINESDIEESPFVEDYISRIARSIATYESRSTEEIRNLKEIIFTFVVHTSNN